MNQEAERPQAVHLQTRSFLRRWISRLPFSAKVAVHMILVILITGISITGMVAYQFQKELYQREYEQAITVFSSTINYFRTHYYSHGNQFVPRDLDFVLSRNFLQIQDAENLPHPKSPDRILLFDPHGTLIYEYVQNVHELGQRPPEDAWQKTYREWHDKKNQAIRVAGPVQSGEDPVGFIHVRIPTHIESDIFHLYQRALGVTAIVVFLSVLLSLLFARTFLNPILALTRAAQRIRMGDLYQKVQVRTEDEVGSLTNTFNQMIETLGGRIQLMHRMQAETVRISRELDRDSLLETLCDIFTRISGSQGYRLYLYNEDGETLEPETECGVEILPKPESDTLAHMAFGERWTQYLKDDGKMDSEPGRILEVAIPLLSGQHRVGVVRIGSRKDEEPYDDETLTILQTLAQHASVSIDNTSLLEKLAEQQRLEQEMALAREIQQAMLPDHEPLIAGYQICGGSLAALDVGGDYFDYIESVDGHLHLILADVSGKGVAAALIMSIVRSLMHTFSEMNAYPLTVLRQLNTRVTRDIEPDMFVTLLMVDLNPETHETRIVRAGHEPILLLKPNGEIRRIAPAGPAIGLLDIASFDQSTRMKTYDLEPGDTMILYTDGVTEARNELGEDFGSKRLEAFLQKHVGDNLPDIYDGIRMELDDFSGSTRHLDDITMILLRRNAE